MTLSGFSVEQLRQFLLCKKIKRNLLGICEGAPDLGGKTIT
jgi:hypothetical protein